MPEGTIKKLFLDRGYGFVEGERGYWFFHQSAVKGASLDALKVGQTVQYEEGCGPSGPRAESVKVV